MFKKMWRGMVVKKMLPNKENMITSKKSQSTLYKEIVNSLLDLIVLRLISQGPKHGYQIVKEIHEKFGVYFKATAIYHLLANFEDNNYVYGEWYLTEKRQRKKFVLTEKGKNAIKSLESELNVINKAQTLPKYYHQLTNYSNNTQQQWLQ
ncbi:MAG: PadR family transcriptional regulator [Candidatus Bathyarchaeota archaeon]|nr:PadR family transcriptional regulator [Candidatus Termiticorpusculum sp.]